MGRRHRAQDQQQWDPRDSQGSSPPPGAWPTPPQGPPPSSPYQGGPPPKPKKRRRIFLWLFLAIQLLFLIWVIVGASTASGTPEDCGSLTGDDLKLCENASEVGTTIGAGLVIGLWAAVDIILGFTYVVYRLASRRT
ncbi:hypothetical protein ACFWDQ_26230 [Streptomyces sp. NPDC060053]|uniref:hypothetical protein n=1 Tax=Streptomyces sp. NPDC060053 TaxID=3347047 RepID=UPI003688EED4